MPAPRLTKQITISLGLALGAPLAAPAQSISNGDANLSTGSGRGTTPGVGPNGSPSSTNTGDVRPGGAGTLRPGSGRGTELGPDALGGGRNRSDAFGASIGDLPGALNGGEMMGGNPLSVDEQMAVEAKLLPDARAITDPSNRSLALERVARVKIFGHRSGDHRFEDAHDALIEAAQAAAQIPDPLTHDIRLLAIIRNTLTLADELTHEGYKDETNLDNIPNPRPKMNPRQRLDLFKRGESERLAAAEYAASLRSDNLRAEMLFRVSDSLSLASQSIVLESFKSGGQRYDLRGIEDVMNRMADRSMVFSANTASRILKAVWRDRAMVAIATAAANSEQFSRGIEVSRTIPQPEYRSDALIRLAEAQSRRGMKDDATTTYDEAAAAVAAIDLDDPRGILASVLIDSLVSVGRYEDARASVVFFPDSQRQLAALGLIVESQGSRRLSDSALAWIDSSAPPQYRETLRRKVSDGMLRAVENSRNAPGQMIEDAAPTRSEGPGGSISPPPGLRTPSSSATPR